MRAYCFKHNKITIGYRESKNSKFTEYIKLRCGCKIKHKDAEKHRVVQKNKYFLRDGREIMKTPSEPIKYELKEKDE